MRFKLLLPKTLLMVFIFGLAPQSFAGERAPFSELDAAFARAILTNQCAAGARPEEKKAVILELEDLLQQALAQSLIEIPGVLRKDPALFASLGTALDKIRGIGSLHGASSVLESSHSHGDSCSHDHDDSHDDDSDCGGGCVRQVIHDAHELVMAIRHRAGLTTRYDRLWDIQKASQPVIRTARHLGPSRLDEEGWKRVIESVDQTHQKLQALLRETPVDGAEAKEAFQKMESGVDTIRKSAELRSETAFRQGASQLQEGFTTLARNPALLPG